MANKKDWWDRTGQKIAKRNWDDVEKQWANDLAIVGHLNQSPAGQVKELARFQEVLKIAVESENKTLVVDSVPGVRCALLGEGIFHFQSGASENLITSLT